MEGNSLSTIGQPLIEINEKNLDATARNPSISHWATLRTFALQNGPNRKKTPGEVMDFWENAWQKISIGYDGKARTEYGKFANLAAAGGGTLAYNDAQMQSLLNEGSRQAQAGGDKKHFYNRGKKQ